mgnify:CR=1 FL=1
MTHLNPTISQLLGKMFPLMAISGLLLAGWGLIVTPDEMKGDAQSALVIRAVPSMEIANN